MLSRFFAAFVAFLFGLNLVSAWHFTPDHADGFYGIDDNDNMDLMFPWNHTAHEASFGTNGTSANLQNRQALPAGTSKCLGNYVSNIDVATLLVQAESYCGQGTLNAGGTTLDNYNAYAWKSGLTFMFICNWNKHGWFSEKQVNCWSAEVAAMIGLVENQCGTDPTTGQQSQYLQAGWYLVSDWNIGMGFQTLGNDGCPGLAGNHDGQESNPTLVAPSSQSSAAPFLAPVEERRRRRV